MKLKSFTLIEILIATIIFMIVVTTAVTSLTMMRKSTNSSNDLARATGCAREVEDFVKLKLRQAKQDQKIYGVSKNDAGVFYVDEIPPGKETRYFGLVIQRSPEEAEVIRKEDSLSSYSYSRLNIPRGESIVGKPLKDYLVIDDEFHGGDHWIVVGACRSFIVRESDIEYLTRFDLDFEKTFLVKNVLQQDKSYYVIKLNDFVYVSPQNQVQAIDKGSYAKISVNEIFAGGGLL